MKITFLFLMTLQILLINLMAQEESRVQELVAELTNYHGSNPKRLIEIKQSWGHDDYVRYLKDMYLHPEKYKKNSPGLQEFLANNAFTVFLKTISHENSLNSKEIEYIHQIVDETKSKEDSAKRGNIYSSVSSMDSFQSLKLLNDFYQSETDLSLKTLILELVTQILSPRSKSSDPYHVEDQATRLPFFQREHESWSEEIIITQNNLQNWWSLLSDKEKKDSTIQENYNSISRILSQAFDQSEDIYKIEQNVQDNSSSKKQYRKIQSVENKNPKEEKKQMRRLASNYSEYRDNSHKPYWIVVSLITTILIFIVLRHQKNKQ